MSHNKRPQKEGRTMDPSKQEQEQEPPVLDIEQQLKDLEISSSPPTSLSDTMDNVIAHTSPAPPPKAAEEPVAASTADAKTPKPVILRRLVDFYVENQFLIHILGGIALARVYPPFGDYLFPEITATWIAVMIIFGTYPMD
jgi:hypothetical protein